MCDNEFEMLDISQGHIIKLKGMVANGYKRLAKEWKSFGLNQEQIKQKESNLERKIGTMFREMVTEEVEFKKRKEVEIESLRDRAKNLISTLNKPEPEFVNLRGSSMEPLVNFEKKLFDLIAWLVSEKEDKVKTFSKLRDEVRDICNELDEQLPHFYDRPKETTVSIMTKYVESMSREKEKRSIKVKELRNSIEESLKALAISPSTDHERIIMYFDEKLGKKLISDLQIFNDSLQQQIVIAKRERESIIRQIRNCTSSIENFPILPLGISKESLAKLNAKLIELRSKKNSHINNLIEEAFESISDLTKFGLSTSNFYSLNKPTALGRSNLEKQMNQNSTFNKSNEEMKNYFNRFPTKPSSNECIIIEENVMDFNYPGQFEQRTKRKFESDFQFRPKTSTSTSENSTKKNRISAFNFESENEGGDLDEDLKHQTSFNIGRDKNRERITIGEELKMLRIIGASKWHKYINGISIWNEMIQRRDAFPGRSLHALRSHFLIKVMGNLASYGLSRNEKNLYLASNEEKKNGIQETHKTPFNPEFSNYNL